MTLAATILKNAASKGRLFKSLPVKITWSMDYLLHCLQLINSQKRERGFSVIPDFKSQALGEIAEINIRIVRQFYRCNPGLIHSSVFSAS